MKVRCTDQFSGNYGIYDVEGLADSLTCYGISSEEAAGYKALEEALKAEEWIRVAALSETLKMDVEVI